MVTTRKRTLAGDVPASPKRLPSAGDVTPRPTPSPLPASAGGGGADDGYEKLRQERIRENQERLQKLGIIDLSNHLKKPQLSPLLSPRRVRSPSVPVPSPALPARRSSRLQNVTPVSYAEIAGKADGDPVKKRGILIEVGAKEEVYTDEHEKLLGTCEASWELFVDGIGKDGRRIYDQSKGMTCHQCRQKTLGHRTRCSTCNLVQGQFCGDCLYMRYGENVLEANKNPNWICPVCRGICNCSLCRIKKGWAPTGSLYRKVLSLGFKSVAHYLIQTRRQKTNSGDENTERTTPKKALHFNSEDPSKPENSLDSEEDLKLVPADENSVECNGKGPESTDEHIVNKLVSADENSVECNGKGPESTDEHIVNNVTAIDHLDLKTESEGVQELAATAKSSPDSTASGLRKRRTKVPADENNVECNGKGSQSTDEHVVNNVTAISSPDLKTNSEGVQTLAATVKPSPDSVASRLRKRRNKVPADENNDVGPQSTEEHIVNNVTAIDHPDLKTESEGVQELTATAKPSPNSIASRLRKRRNKV